MLKLYERLTGQRVADRKTQRDLAESRKAPPVPSTAIYTRGDGIVAWQNCVEPESPTTDNIEVHGSHCGLGVNPAVLYAIADCLAQDEGDWKPFDLDIVAIGDLPVIGPHPLGRARCQPDSKRAPVKRRPSPA